jgi:hypothetical protein
MKQNPSRYIEVICAVCFVLGVICVFQYRAASGYFFGAGLLAGIHAARLRKGSVSIEKEKRLIAEAPARNKYAVLIKIASGATFCSFITAILGLCLVPFLYNEWRIFLTSLVVMDVAVILITYMILFG